MPNSPQRRLGGIRNLFKKTACFLGWFGLVGAQRLHFLIGRLHIARYESRPLQIS